MRPTQTASHATIIPSGNQFVAGRNQYNHPRRYANVHPPGKWARNDLEKADILAEHLQEVFMPHNNAPGQDVMSYLIEHSHPKFFTFMELIQAIKSLKTNKAPDMTTSQLHFFNNCPERD
jgi:hypothetical protein